MNDKKGLNGPSAVEPFQPWGVPEDTHAHQRQAWRWQHAPGKASRYSGVTRRGSRWNAHLIRRSLGIACSLGSFTGEASAARAYDLIALVAYGDDAATNFSKERYYSVLTPQVASLLRRGFSSDARSVRKAARAALAWLVTLLLRQEAINPNRKDNDGTTNALTG